jgi:TP901 family phage tail tape measure protein
MASRKIFELFGSIVIEGLGANKKAITQLNKDIRASNKVLNKMGRDAAKMGKTITKFVTVPLLGAAAAAVKFGADFDQSMTNSLAIMGDVSAEMREELEMTAREVAKTTKFSATQAAEAYFFLASAGLDAAESMQALPKVAAFAQAGNFDLAKATDLLTDAQSALGKTLNDPIANMEEMVKLSDILVGANTIANASVEQFSESLTNKGAAALRLLNKDTEEGVAVLAAFASQGVKGKEAGEKLNIVLRDLQNAAINNKKGFDQAGISVFDASGKMRNMADIVEDMEDRLLGMSDEQKRSELSLLGFTDRSISATSALLGMSDAIRGFEEDLRATGGITAEVAEKQMKTFWAQLGLVKDQVIDLSLTLFKGLVPILMDYVIPAIKSVAEVVSDMMVWFGQHKNLTTFIATFVTALAVMGPILTLFAKFIPLIKSTVALYKVLTASQVTLNAVMATNPIGLIVTGIAALIAAGVLLWKNWDTVKEKFVETWGFIAHHFKNIASGIAIVYSNMIIGILEGINKIGKFIPGLNKGLNSLINTYRSSIKVLEAQTEARKTLRTEQLAAKKLTEEEAKAIAEAKKLADELNKTTNEATVATTKNTQAKKDNEKATLAQAEADKKAAQARKEAADADFKISQDLASAKADLEEDSLKQLEMITKLKLAQNEFEKTEALRIGEEKGLNLSNITALYKAREDRIIKDSAVKEIKIAEDVKKQRLAIAQKTMSTISSVAGEINALWQAALDLRVAQIDEEGEKRKTAIENSLLSEEEKAEKIAQIDEELDAKKLELQKENARREKLASIFGIILNTAMAVSASLAVGLPQGAVLAAIAAALGLAQLAIATATPIPFAEGGLVQSSPGKGVLAQIGEGSQDELVLPMKTGAVELAKNIMGQMGSISGNVASSAKMATTELHFNIGTLIADEIGIKKFSKKVRKHIIAEDQRVGV